MHLRLPISEKNTRRNPYLNNLEDGEESVKEGEDLPNPSSCSLQMCIPILAKFAPL